MNLAYNIGQGFAQRAIAINKRSMCVKYALQGDTLYAVIPVGAPGNETYSYVEEPMPTDFDIKALLLRHHSFRPAAIDAGMLYSFRLGYTKAFLQHIQETQNKD